MNHTYEPNSESAGLALVSTSPAEDERRVICQACGQVRTIVRGRYCSPCTASGLDSPIINCAIEGCEITARRRYPGQQAMICSAHQDETP